MLHLAASGLERTALSFRAALGWKWVDIHWVVAFLREQQQLAFSLHARLPDIVATLLSFLVEVTDLVGFHDNSWKAHVADPVVAIQEVVQAVNTDTSFEEARCAIYATATASDPATSCDEEPPGGDMQATIVGMSFEEAHSKYYANRARSTRSFTFANIGTHFKSERVPYAHSRIPSRLRLGNKSPRSNFINHSCPSGLFSRNYPRLDLINITSRTKKSQFR